MADIGKIGFSVDTAGLKQGEQALDSFNQKQKQVAQGAKDLNVAQTQVATSSSATAKAVGDVNSAIAGTIPATANAARAAGALESAHLGAAASTRTFREALHTLAPVAYAAGIPIQGLGIFAGAARGGLAGLAIAMGGSIILALEKAGDESRILKGRLQDLLGTNAGNAAFGNLRQAADQAHTSVGALEPVLEQIIRAQEQLDSQSGLRFAPGQHGQYAAAAQTISTFTQALQLNGETASKAAASVATYFQAMLQIDQTGKMAGLTADTFRKIEIEAPAAAAAIASAFNMSTADLEAALQRGAMNVADFARGLATVAPDIQKKFAAMEPNVSQSFDRMGSAWGRFEDKMNNDQGTFAHMLQGITYGIDLAGDHTNVTINTISSLLSLGTGGAPVIQVINNIISDIEAIPGAVSSALAALQRLVAGVNVAKANQSLQYGVDTTGVGYVPSGISFDASNAGSGLDNSGDLLQFATGGLATVQGSGGTDSQLVQFMATPGEVVAVGMPGSVPGSAGGGSVTNLAGISMTVVQSLAQLNSALQSAASKVSSSSSKLASSTSTAASAMSYSINIANGGAAVPWKGFAINNNPNGQDYAAPPDQYVNYPALWNSPPSAADSPPPPVDVVNMFGGGSRTYDAPSATNSMFQDSYYDPSTYAPSGSLYDSASSDYSSLTDSSNYADYGFFASGGSFRVGGSGGTDSQMVAFRASPGEHVNVSPGPGGSGSAKRIGGGMKVMFQMQPGRSGGPPAFFASSAQIDRALRMRRR